MKHQRVFSEVKFTIGLSALRTSPRKNGAIMCALGWSRSLG